MREYAVVACHSVGRTASSDLDVRQSLVRIRNY